ncbi:MAG: alanine racemase [Clostridia bacterium]|nr:alanine racemase [Clostridia bacterium]
MDTGQIVKNYNVYKSALPGKAQIIAVVKANAYGHGDEEIARSLEAGGADFFAVSNINEAIRLRFGGISGEILVLGYTPPYFLPYLTEYDIIQTAVSEEHIEELKKYAPSGAKVHIAIDTGMKRIGLDSEDCERCVKIIKSATSALKITGVFTHFPVADSSHEADRRFTKQSLDKFRRIVTDVKPLGIELIHCLNSAGGIAYFDAPFNTVRLGISLYGYSPSPQIKLPLGIKPAMSWKTLVSAVIKVSKGEGVGYGRSFIASQNMRIATLTTGYADGYPRAASNKGFVLIKGKRARIVGRVCMDMMMVDVTDIPDVKMGDFAVIIGNSGTEVLSADDIAKCADSISYEILTGISARVERIYK